MNRAFPQLGMDPVYGFSHYLVAMIYGMFFRGDIAGLENLPQQGAFLLAANHASFLDPPFIICLVPRQIASFARKTLWKPGFASWWLDEVGTIPVDRDGGQDVSAIKRVLKTLKEDKGLILFPEGTRTPDGHLQKPKAGVGLIACRAQVPVVPVRIYGSFEAGGKGRPLRLGTPVTVIFGSPIAPGTYDDPTAGKERYQLASQRIFERIAALTEPHYAVI